MSAEIKERIRRVLEEGWGGGKLETIDEFYSPNIVAHFPPMLNVTGLQQYKDTIMGFRQAIPDLRFKMDEIIVEGDVLAVSYTATGTHTAQSPVFPFPPNGKAFKATGITIGHMKEGKGVEEFVQYDWLGAFQQQGIIPSLTAAPA